VSLIAPDRGCIEVDVGSTRYHGNRLTGVDSGHAAALRAAGYVDSGPGGVARTAGYRCPDCGFRAFFTRCGRCGGTCTRATQAP
jgi:hypothetical protein